MLSFRCQFGKHDFVYISNREPEVYGHFCTQCGVNSYETRSRRFGEWRAERRQNKYNKRAARKAKRTARLLDYLIARKEEEDNG